MTKNYQKVFTKVACPKSFLLLPKCSWGHVRVNFTSQKKAFQNHPRKSPISQKIASGHFSFSVFENGLFENYLLVKQRLQCKDCFLFIA